MSNVSSFFKQWWLPLLVCLVAVTWTHWQWLQPGIPSGHDIGFHMTRAQLFLRALHEGQFPVRWLEWQDPGLSHPLFTFYPPGFYYAVSVVAMSGVPYVLATKATIFLCGVISWLGIYLLMKRWFSNTTALVAATLWLLAPYRLTQLWVRASFPEYFAISFVPWIFIGVEEIMANSVRRGVAILTIATSLIIISHQPTLIMFAPILGGWVLWKIWQTGEWRVIRWFFLSGVLSLGLTSFFWLPLITEQQYIRPDMLRSLYFAYEQHFATLQQIFWSRWGYGISVAGDRDEMSFQLGLIPWVLVAIAAVGVGWRSQWQKMKNFSKSIVILGVCAVIFGIFMSTVLSNVFWVRLSVLGFLQYPWRYLGVATMGSVFLVGLLDSFPDWLGFSTGKKDHEARKALVVTMGALLVGSAAIATWSYRHPARQLGEETFQLERPDLHDEFFASNPLLGVERGYLPKWVQEVQTKTPPPKVAVQSGNGEATPGEWRMTHQEFTVNAPLETTVRVATHYYPGWKVWRQSVGADGSLGLKQLLEPNYDNSQGMIDVTLPAGKHRVTLELQNTPTRHLANTISLLSFVTLIGGEVLLGLWPIFRRSQEKS